MLRKPFTAVLMPYLEKFEKLLPSLEEVTLEIIRCNCIPDLLYGTEAEACLLNKTDLSSLDFFINRLFMKLFNEQY